MDSITVRGFAKINLHLDVTGLLPNGFHSVANVMQSVSLCDTLTLTRHQRSTCLVSCDVAAVPLGESNIVSKALNAFSAKIKTAVKVDIDIQKSIPMAAGLAGGSADAAATLLGLNALYGEPLSTEELCEVGGQIGADVPFCIVCGSAYADGKGDVLHPFPAIPDCTIVIAAGGEGVSTPAAYRRLDELYNRFEAYTPRSLDALKNALESKNINAVADNIFNIFEAPTLEVHSVAKSIKQALLDAGALGAMMSGSGPSVFGIFNDEAVARIACDNIRGMGITPHICKPWMRGCDFKLF